ncbi:MAG: DUF1345 domain-containing protein [Actinomycetota bacterium]|nr:DUF1345 domain-containing protein [Actinomycetota bacterium]
MTSARDLPHGDAGRHDVSARTRLLTSLIVGVAIGIGVSVPGAWRYGLLLGWISAAAVFIGWMWFSIWPMDARRTAAHAAGENPGRALTDIMMLGASVASLLAVGLLLSGGSGNKVVQAGLSILAVASAWAVVHTVFTTRYARLYYSGSDGGIDFNQEDPPQYSDFAYLAFTIGMTFQVSDTDLKTKMIRATALRHMLLSYLFGAVIIATTINLVAGLSK